MKNNQNSNPRVVLCFIVIPILITSITREACRPNSYNLLLKKKKKIQKLKRLI